jgi:hypothetical protein
MVDHDDEVGTALPSKLDDRGRFIGAQQPVTAAGSYGINGLLHGDDKPQASYLNTITDGTVRLTLIAAEARLGHDARACALRESAIDHRS